MTTFLFSGFHNSIFTGSRTAFLKAFRSLAEILLDQPFALSLVFDPAEKFPHRSLRNTGRRFGFPFLRACLVISAEGNAVLPEIVQKTHVTARSPGADQVSGLPAGCRLQPWLQFWRVS